MKILLISPYPIAPPLHGGRVRTARMAEALGRAGAVVDVLCPWYPGQPRKGRVADAFTCHSHLLASNLLPWAMPRLAAPLALLSFQPPPRRLLRAFAGYDVVQLDFCAHANWLRDLPRGARIVYSAHNVERDFCEHDAGRYAFSRASLGRIESLEACLARQSDLVITCTADDATRLERLYGELRRTLVIPNGCPAPLLDFDRAALREVSRAGYGLAPDERALLFVGGDASHNRDAVDFLVADVLPRLGSRARLLVAGKCASARRRSNDGRVRFLGFVGDLSPCFAAADVAVNPIERGSGSSAKLLEYLAAGLPVVSTALGARGFADLPAGLLVTRRERFADVLASPLTELAPDRAALRELAWESLGRTLLREYEELCRP